jgi:hypothetical protein
MGLDVDQSPHGRDGLLLHGWDGDRPVAVFIGSRIMDRWAGAEWGHLTQAERNRLGQCNIDVIEQIARIQYQRCHGFGGEALSVTILPADIAESGARLDTRKLARRSTPLPTLRTDRGVIHSAPSLGAADRHGARPLIDGPGRRFELAAR